MSRYELVARKGRYQVFVGWDPPLETYFLQVYDTQARDPESQPFTWLGASGEHLDYTDLTRALEPFAELPLDIAAKLSSDRTGEQ
jgi:hypothetical protein